jgi:hypothetical protein
VLVEAHSTDSELIRRGVPTGSRIQI